MVLQNDITVAIVAGWWGIWDIIAGLALATFWASRSAKKKAAKEGVLL